MKPPPKAFDKCFEKPAAFRRLCVETADTVNQVDLRNIQPPSGGCVLKRIEVNRLADIYNQPPSGGCVLKPSADSRQTG